MLERDNGEWLRLLQDSMMGAYRPPEQLLKEELLTHSHLWERWQNCSDFHLVFAWTVYLCTGNIYVSVNAGETFFFPLAL